ncbi:MAG: beta galactosidase jelly roll domain-containing protein [Cyclobacteriaceae bacterium]|nr:beta galactosidase jelly roll domain-containing protein [Cyclobacteriaceae bacterium]
MRTLTLVLFLLPGLLAAQVIDLRGPWRFHIDDKPAWASAEFDDSSWETLFTPSAWEEEGFHGYDGFAWYRRTFDGRQLDKNVNYYLGLGFIDDCDEVYVNGKLVGFSGSMPPRFKTAYNKERKYPLPAEFINFSGPNTIAIRVFDVTLSGGIIDGRLGIYKSKENDRLAVDLRGVWSFTPIRRMELGQPELEWKKIMVPEAWEYQGHAKYDGYARYQRTFLLPDRLAGTPLVLLVGKIDDFDKTYINGKLIGTTNDGKSYGRSESYDRQRAYPIPADALKKGLNTIDILVEDMGNLGGIYTGIVGIARQEDYARYLK